MPNNRRRLVGRVVSDKMQKTVVVAIERRKTHPIYKKVVKSTKKVMAHDESDAIQIGALVRIVESKPLSKNKRWVVETVLEETDIPVLEALADEAIVMGGSVKEDAVMDDVEVDDADADDADADGDEE
jgi:small subunit ribosomal protein S17